MSIRYTTPALDLTRVRHVALFVAFIPFWYLPTAQRIMALTLLTLVRDHLAFLVLALLAPILLALISIWFLLSLIFE